MPGISQPRLLILETSGRGGQVALAEGGLMRGLRRMEESRRHARDLAPSVRDLLREQDWKPRDLHAVIVSRGPGSYTGLRVGIMSAKALAYATGCALIAIDTFAAIAHQTPSAVATVDVIADAQQEKVYVQRYVRDAASGAMTAEAPLRIRTFSEWVAELAQCGHETWVTGPGLPGQESRLSSTTRVVPARHWDPLAESLLALALPRYERGERDDPWALEPLYLRPSAAEQQWQAKGAKA